MTDIKNKTCMEAFEEWLADFLLVPPTINCAVLSGLFGLDVLFHGDLLDAAKRIGFCDVFKGDVLENYMPFPQSFMLH